MYIILNTSDSGVTLFRNPVNQTTIDIGENLDLSNLLVGEDEVLRSAHIALGILNYELEDDIFYIHQEDENHSSDIFGKYVKE